MTKQELMDAIYDLDPSYIALKINLDQYTEEELQICYDRKKNAPIQRRRSGTGGWYGTTSSRKSEFVRPKATDNYEEVPYSGDEKKSEGVALTGFDALRKEN